MDLKVKLEKNGLYLVIVGSKKIDVYYKYREFVLKFVLELKNGLNFLIVPQGTLRRYRFKNTLFYSRIISKWFHVMESRILIGSVGYLNHLVFIDHSWVFDWILGYSNLDHSHVSDLRLWIIFEFHVVSGRVGSSFQLGQNRINTKYFELGHFISIVCLEFWSSWVSIAPNLGLFYGFRIIRVWILWVCQSSRQSQGFGLCGFKTKLFGFESSEFFFPWVIT